LNSDISKYQRQFDKDRFAKHNGIYLVDATPGFAIVKMEVQEFHMNSVGVIHGGAIFTLADFAFAVASNSHGRVALAIDAGISFFKALHSGVLTATAREISLNNRLGTYLIDVLNENEELIATFRGTVYRKSETLVFD
jgi:acyl-CoA thioesterase